MPIEKVNKIVQEGTMMSGNRLIRWKMERKWIFEGEKSQKASEPDSIPLVSLEVRKDLSISGELVIPGEEVICLW